MTFRLPEDLSESLRRLPNQSRFVEGALREALERVCPLCQGTGEAPPVHLSISDLKRQIRLDRAAAAQLKSLIQLGRELLATQLLLDAAPDGAGLGFKLERQDQVLLSGRIPNDPAAVRLAH